MLFSAIFVVADLPRIGCGTWILSEEFL